jgi:hypothetical protein
VVVVGPLGVVSGPMVGFSLGKLVGALDIVVGAVGDDGVEGGVMINMGAGVVGGVVVTVGGVDGATGAKGAGVGTIQLGEEQFPNMTKDTVVFDPLAWVQI